MTTWSTTTTSTPTTSTTSTSAPPAEEGIDPVGDPGREAVASPAGFPAGSGPTALLVDVRVAARDGFDRMVPFAGGGIVEELLLIGDFEGQNASVIGLEREAPFGVTLLEDPIRLVVDVVAEG